MRAKRLRAKRPWFWTVDGAARVWAGHAKWMLLVAQPSLFACSSEPGRVEARPDAGAATATVSQAATAATIVDGTAGARARIAGFAVLGVVAIAAIVAVVGLATGRELFDYNLLDLSI